MDVTNILLYPFTKSVEYLVENFAQESKYKIKAAVGFKGGGYKGYRVKRGMEVISVSEAFEERMKECDALLPLLDVEKQAEAAPFSVNKTREQIVIERVKLAISMGKKVVLIEGAAFSDRIRNLVPKELREELNVDVKFPDEYIPMHIFELGIPVVYVFSAIESSMRGKFAINIQKALSERGYKVSVVSEDNKDILVGVDIIGTHYKKEKFSLTEKIIYVNNYLKKMELEQQPDVIVVNIPGGSTPYSTKAPLDFGETLFRYLRAVPPDYAILCLPQNFQSGEVDTREWKKYYQAEFGVDVNDIFVESDILNTKETELSMNPKYTYLDDVECIREETEQINNLADKIINELITYGEIMVC
ncbi:MAG: hypothetical protein K6A30_01165 [Lachnospiraceae bacterium]|nr:hypothetical protein [Lachnospiraceae bacterium]